MKCIKILKCILLPLALLLVLVLATPAMAAEEIVIEPVERPKHFQSVQSQGDALISEADLEAFTKLFLKELKSCPVYVDVRSLTIPYVEGLDKYLREQIWYSMPEAFNCYSIGIVHNYNIITDVWIAKYYDYADTESEYAACYAQFKAGADYLLDGIEGNEALSEVEKALLLHDRLAVWTAYDIDGYDYDIYSYPDEDFSAYGALGNRLAVCQGYAMAYMYLLDRVGIENEYCSSDTLNHAWNIVYIDGVPYHVDVTWDDPVEDETGRASHDNFLRSTEGMWETYHTADDYDSTPVDTKYDDYYWQSSNAAFQLLDGKLYYIDGDEGALKCVDNDTTTTLLEIEMDWLFYGHYSKLDCDEGFLLYSTASGIYAYEPNNGENRQIYTFTGNAENREQIYGFVYENGYLTFEIQGRTPSYEYYTTVFREPFDLLNALPKNGWYEGCYYEDDQLVTDAWRENENGRFYLSATGTLTANAWLTHNGKKCYVGKDGYCVKNGWLTDGSGWCRLDADGYVVVSDWVTTDGKIYYCDAEGYRVTGVNVIDGKEYLFASDGALVEQQAAAIVNHPQSVATDTGNTVKFSVSTQGKVVTYRWQYRSIYKWFDTYMSGYNTDTLTVEATGFRNGYDYRCVITFADGTVLTSNMAELTVNTFITDIENPNTQTVVLGYKGQFSANAKGEGLKFYWYYQRPDSNEWYETKMDGYNQATVFVESTTARDGYKYRCRITDVTGKEIFTEPATMRVLSFKSHPQEVFASAGTNVKFTVSTSVSDGFTYRWYYRKNANSSWIETSMTGYNTATLTVPATVARNGYEYRCVLTGSKSSKIESKPAILHCGNPVVITTQPESITASAGSTVNISVKASSAYSYQWYYSTNGGTSWRVTAFTGAKTETLQVPVTVGRNGYLYRCTIKGLDGTEVVTNAAKLTVK